MEQDKNVREGGALSRAVSHSRELLLSSFEKISDRWIEIRSPSKDHYLAIPMSINCGFDCNPRSMCTAFRTMMPS